MKTEELQKRQQTVSISFTSKTEEGDFLILIPPENNTVTPSFNVPQFKVSHNLTFNFSDPKPIISMIN
jgi:uncharacterized membrane protein